MKVTFDSLRQEKYPPQHVLDFLADVLLQLTDGRVNPSELPITTTSVPKGLGESEGHKE